ncbi:hypothetical protein J3R75_000083 [Oligosphaera ethanolica]|uniref:Uncharacterized protein n=1 Tax=Oligosphaera ethanolica TaxID=760260 RepID=A0AAE3VD47_9BACT|nr:hypothetical protein [Oligosphaera ethanolica]
MTDAANKALAGQCGYWDAKGRLVATVTRAQG